MIDTRYFQVLEVRVILDCSNYLTNFVVKLFRYNIEYKLMLPLKSLYNVEA